MVETRERLLGRKEDVLAALRALERDHEEGSIDEGAYTTARQRYELEAAALLERLDTLDAGLGPSARRPPVRTLTVVGMGAAVLVVVAITIFLVAALRERGGGTITGDAPPVVATPAPAPSPQLLAAVRRVRLHPRSVNALLALGNAYLAANQPGPADGAFLRAMRLARAGSPLSAEASTMHALIEGEMRSVPKALALLTVVEAAHPAYAHAWLVDGLLASRSRTTLPRAIHAYRRFLALDPHSPVTREVRALLAGLLRAGKGKP